MLKKRCYVYAATNATAATTQAKGIKVKLLRSFI